MNAPLLHKINDQHLWLSPQRCIFWEEASALILSDTHFAKTGHFRKNGIAIPPQVYKEDLQRLINLVAHFKPTQIIAVGDLFHSYENKELDLFLKWRMDMAYTKIILVRGNHDLLHSSWYEAANIEVVEGILKMDNFSFVHDAAEINGTNNTGFHFSGHVHPGIAIRGIAKQYLQFPCFYFGKDHCILPAFSKFSGLKLMKPKKINTIYAIANGKLIQC